MSEILPKLPPGWRWTTLGEVSTIRQGQSPPSSSYREWQSGEGMPFVQGNREFGSVCPAPTKRTVDPRVVAAPGSVLVSVRAPVGDTNIAPSEPLAIGRGLASIAPDDDVDLRFLLCVLRAARPALLAQATGTTFDAITGRVLKELPVALPPFAEQAEIAGAYERYAGGVAEAVEELVAARKGLRAYQRAVLESQLGRIAPLGSSFEPGAAPPLPAGWVWQKVEDVGEVQLGRMRSPERHYGPNMRRYLRVANVLDDRLDLVDIDEMDFPPSEFERYRLRHGDILLNEGQSPELLGRAAMWRDEEPDMCYQKSLIRFRAGDRVDPEFALLVFRHYLYSGRFQRESRITTGIAHLTAIRFSKIEFPVPPLGVQQKIVAVTRRQLDEVASLGHEIQEAEMTAASLVRSAGISLLSGGANVEERHEALAGSYA